MLKGSHRPRQALSRAALPVFAVLAAAALLGGCATLGYYTQAIGGQLEVIADNRDIDEVLADPATPAETRRKLALVRDARTFAVTDLGLPDNRSYRRYRDLGRQFVVWNVFVAPEFSTTAREWCFPVVGCVSYRGYFTQARADEFAAGERGAGNDVYVGGVAAYSTLGWFSDPVLNTVLTRSDTDLVGLLFHELAHQLLYVKDDSAFNESFATVIELEGVRRWVARDRDDAGFADYRARLQRRDEFVALVLATRGELDRLYATDLDADAKRARKVAALTAMQDEYGKLKQRWGGYTGFDAWFAKDVNNAKLAAVGTYYRHVAPLQRLLAEKQGNLPAFYAAVRDLAALTKEERAARLKELAQTAVVGLN
jgi:predicted aminopeptidase